MRFCMLITGWLATTAFVAFSVPGIVCQTIPLHHIHIIPQELASIGWKLFGTIAHESSEDSTVD